MAETKTYNGWTNYETWNVALWLDNEQSSERYWRCAAQDAWDESPADDAVVRGTWTREEAAKYNLADKLKNEITDSVPDLGASMWSDLLGAALSEVNWDEIAENWLASVDKDETKMTTIKIVTSPGSSATMLGDAYSANDGVSWHSSVDCCDSDGNGRVFLDCEQDVVEYITQMLDDDDRVVSYSTYT